MSFHPKHLQICVGMKLHGEGMGRAKAFVTLGKLAGLACLGMGRGFLNGVGEVCVIPWSM